MKCKQGNHSEVGSWKHSCFRSNFQHVLYKKPFHCGPSLIIVGTKISTQVELLMRPSENLTVIQRTECGYPMQPKPILKIWDFSFLLLWFCTFWSLSYSSHPHLCQDPPLHSELDKVDTNVKTDKICQEQIDGKNLLNTTPK